VHTKKNYTRTHDHKQLINVLLISWFAHDTYNNFNFDNLWTLNNTTNIQIKKINVEKLKTLREHFNTIWCCWKTYNKPPKDFCLVAPISFFSLKIQHFALCSLLSLFHYLSPKPKYPYLRPRCKFLQMKVPSINNYTQDLGLTL